MIPPKKSKKSVPDYLRYRDLGLSRDGFNDDYSMAEREGLMTDNVFTPSAAVVRMFKIYVMR
jgi:hypothetical protein